MRIVWLMIRILVGFIALAIIFLATALSTVDKMPIYQQPFYALMKDRLNDLSLGNPHQVKQKQPKLKVGWAAVNITPTSAVQLVGYQPRGPHQVVHDSLFVRTLLFDDGITEIAIISLDLLLFPPLVVHYLTEKLPTIGMEINQTYFSATHTHTAYGGWLNSLAGNFITGSYQPKIVAFIGDKIIAAIQKASETKAAGSISFKKILTHNLVENRLQPSAPTDNFIRVIDIKKDTGARASLVSFTAHATLIDKDIHELSGDYPHALVKSLEEQLDFAMFCAGMVGSHRAKGYGLQDFDFVADYGKKLADIITSRNDSSVYVSEPQLEIHTLPLALPKSQMRLGKNLIVRDWLFSLAIGSLQANIKVLRIGNILMLGMPCDFSGELAVEGNFDSLANANDYQLFITSFNGNYIGYISADQHYASSSKEEVRALNWVGPGMGNYFVEIVKDIIQKH